MKWAHVLQMFPLPSQAARGTILGIHTRRWDPPPRADLLAELAQRCVGFCGADLKVPIHDTVPVIFMTFRRDLLIALVAYGMHKATSYAFPAIRRWRRTPQPSAAVAWTPLSHLQAVGKIRPKDG